MDATPEVAVVLPFRNAVDWLPQSLNSLLHQGSIQAELVAVDDGSCDGSSELLKRIWPRLGWPLTLLRLDGEGVSRARNAGWRATRAPLVAFLDADDLALPGRLRTQRDLLLADPSLDHCLCGWRRIDSGGHLLAEVRPWEEGAGFSVDQVMRHKAVLPSAWMVRREALEAVGGFDPGLHHAEDVDLLLRLAIAGRRGAWCSEIGCGYRVHTKGASRQVRNQTRSLLWVLERQLRRLSATPQNSALTRELRYSTRAWAGWLAWVECQPALAAELWRTSLGLTPMPPARTWLHMAENSARNSRRHGLSFNLQQLLGDPLWLQLEGEWIERWSGPDFAGRLLQRLRTDLLETLGTIPQASPWWPAKLRAQLQPGDSLRPLRERVLSWCEELIAADVRNEQGDKCLAGALAQLLLEWVEVSWSEEPRYCRQLLDQALAIAPQPAALFALARLEQRQFPAGAQALRQLANRLPPLGQVNDSPRLPAEAVFWERLNQEDRCTGPHCRPCSENELAAWRQEELAPGCMRWWPPASQVRDPPFAIQRLSGGRAWVRHPANPWALTHGLGVAPDSGKTIAHFSRRYPQPWLGCPVPGGEPEPLPAGNSRWIAGRVLAVADLSAENHYHWLVDSLPRLGRAVELLLRTEGIEGLKIWHNAGDGPIVRECFTDLLGLDSGSLSEILIDAHSHPYIQAEELLVPDFAGRFAVPAADSVRWWRQRLALSGWHDTDRRSQPVQHSVQWWWRGAEVWRRPVWGERRALKLLVETLPDLKIEVVEPVGMRLQDQAQQLSKADLVVMPHGACLGNLLMAKPGTRVLELCTDRYCPPYSHGVAQALGLELYTCLSKSKTPQLYKELLYEGSVVEPLCLDPIGVTEAIRSILANISPKAAL